MKKEKAPAKKPPADTAKLRSYSHLPKPWQHVGTGSRGGVTHPGYRPPAPLGLQTRRVTGLPQLSERS